MREDWKEALAAFYREVDAEIAEKNPTCAGCGACCRFDEAEHILYASLLERLYLGLASPPANPDADAALLASGMRCPFQSGGRCLARDHRALGCRLHFCTWPDRAEAEEMAERWHRRLKQIHDQLGAEWRYAPLLPITNPDA